MKLLEVTLQDVGVYAGTQTMDLRTSDNQAVVLIGGLNGCGKTTLLDSLLLALYGNRANLASRKSEAYDRYLASNINRKQNPEFGSSIRLKFLAGDGQDSHEYDLTRSWAQHGARIREFVSVSIDGIPSEHHSSNWADCVEDLLPLELAQLFFFDGEKIAALADPDRAPVVIESAITALLGIGSLEQLSRDLLALQRKQVPLQTDNAEDREVLQAIENVQRAQETMDTLSQRRAGLQVARHQADKAFEKVHAEFQRIGGPLYERRQVLEQELSQQRETLVDIKAKLVDLAEGALPFAMVLPLAELAVEAAQNAVNARRDSDLVHLLEERDAWVLKLVGSNRELASQLAEDRSRRSSASSPLEPLHIVDADVDSMRVAMAMAEADRQTGEERLGQAQTIIERIAQIETLLTGIADEGNISDVAARLELARNECLVIDGQLAEVDENLRIARNNLQDAQNRADSAESSRLMASVQNEDVMRIVDHAGRVRATLAEMRARLISRHIGKIEAATLKSLQSLLRKTHLVKDLRIDPETFTIQLFDADGEPIHPDALSAGERQLFAAALLWGITRVADIDTTVVIDTPLGRLDSVHRQRLVDVYFPQAGSQVLLLSTDEEIDEHLYKSLSPHLGRTYLLQHDDSQQATRITSGYWWGDSDVA